MDFSEFVVKLFNLCFFFFSRTDNIICFVPTFSLYFCFCWGLVTFLVRGWYR